MKLKIICSPSVVETKCRLNYHYCFLFPKDANTATASTIITIYSSSRQGVPALITAAQGCLLCWYVTKYFQLL